MPIRKHADIRSGVAACPRLARRAPTERLPSVRRVLCPPRAVSVQRFVQPGILQRIL